jgi:glutamyl-tRNA reductase
VELALVGVDHRLASVAVREHLHLDAEGLGRLYALVQDRGLAVEAFALSTCNRTELLVAGARPIDGAALWDAVVQAAGGARLRVPWRFLTGDAAAAHVLRVVAGLESAVLGDSELVAQIRAARDLAHASGVLGKYLHRLLRLALTTGGRVRSDTGLAAGGAGIGSTVATAVADLLGSDRRGHARVGVVGAGSAAASTLGQLHRRGVRSLEVVNRHRDRAVATAAQVGATVHDWSDLPARLASWDIAVVLTAGGVIITPEVWAQVGPTPGLVVIDGGMPRAVARRDGVRVLGLDDLAGWRDATIARREAAIPAAEAIVACGLDQWSRWQRQVALDAYISDLYANVERRADELVQGLDERTGREVRRTLRRSVHDHVVALRAGA